MVDKWLFFKLEKEKNEMTIKVSSQPWNERKKYLTKMIKENTIYKNEKSRSEKIKDKRPHEDFFLISLRRNGN